MPTEDALRAAIAAALPASGPATVYGRKLRRLLLAALEAPSGQALHDAVFELSHAAGYEHCHPGEPAALRAAAERDRLDDPAYRAVCDVAAWIATGPFGFADRHRAISALRCSWTRFAGAYAPIIAAFDAHVHGYRRPPAAGDAEPLVQRIEQAFAETPIPGALTAAASDEACDVALLFAGARWQTIDPALFELEPAALSLLTDDAFRYLVPAYMRADLLGASSASPVFALTHLGPPGHPRERLDVFAPAERAAIIAYLRACRAANATREIQHALEAYWLR